MYPRKIDPSLAAGASSGRSYFKRRPDARETDVQPSGIVDWLALQTVSVFGSASVIEMPSMLDTNTPVGVACAGCGRWRPSIMRRGSRCGLASTTNRLVW